MRVFFQKVSRITRIVQPAGTHGSPKWSDGICVRLPFGWSVIVIYGRPSPWVRS